MTSEKTRVGDYNTLDVFPDRDGVSVKIEAMLDTEMVLHDYEEKLMTKEGEDIWGVGMYLTVLGDESDKHYKILSFSEVIVSQAKRCPKETLPLNCRFEQKGSGTRKFFSMA